MGQTWQVPIGTGQQPSSTASSTADHSPLVCLQVNEFGAGPATEPLVKSELVSITPVTITATPPGGCAAADASEGAEPEAKRQRVEGVSGGEQQAAAGGMDIASVSVEGPAACYVCELPDVPGKFLPQKVRRQEGLVCAGCAKAVQDRGRVPATSAAGVHTGPLFKTGTTDGEPSSPSQPLLLPPPPSHRPPHWVCRAARRTAAWCAARR